MATNVRLDPHPPKRLRCAICAPHHLAMSPRRHPLLTIRNLTSRNTDRIFNHERDYSEENGFPRTAQRCIREKNSDQRKVEESFDNPPVFPRTRPRLLCEGTQFGVRRRSAVFFDNRGDLRLANPCSRWCVARVFPTHTRLIVPLRSRHRRCRLRIFKLFGNTLRITCST